MPRTVALIPVRKGSKGIPGKNLRPLLGKPLLQWTIEQAKDSGVLDDIVVSSDWDEALALAERLGVSWLERPAELATDTATTESVIDHMLANVQADTVVLLQATSPLRDAHDIGIALEVFRQGGGDSLFSAVKFRRFLWWNRSGRIGPLNYTLLVNRPRRQDITDAAQWMENGSIYIFDVQGYLHPPDDATRVMGRNRLFGKIGVYEQPEWTQHELDSEDDWPVVEAMMREHLPLSWPPGLTSALTAKVEWSPTW